MAAGDLTVTARVQELLAPEQAADTTGVIPQLITALSAYVANSVVNRRGLNNNASQVYTDTLDGSGSDRLMMRDWPITAVASVLVFGQAIPQSPDGVNPGWMFDDYSIILLPNTTVGATINNFPYFFGRFPRGRQNVKVTYTAGYTGSTRPPVDVNYNNTPSDLGAAVTFLVAQEYKRRSWIDQRSKTLGVGESISFRDWEWPPWVNRVMEAYKRHIWS